jgi:outer membrane protein assembly factor BamB
MKLLTNDIIFTGISVFIITTFSVLLYADFNKKIEAGDVKQIGTITFKREVAQRKYQSQVVWEGIDQNFPVYNNDSIRTSDLSEAVIHLLDGTDINIEENSMIMLSTLENAININFEQGSISANRSGVSGTDIASINIKSQDATVSIDKSNIQLTQLDNQELDLTVSDGTAKVKSGAAETLIKTNEKAVISTDRKETRVVQLKFNLKEPSSNRYYISETLKTGVSFSWELAGNFKNITWEISKDRSFKRIFSSQKSLQQNNVKADLEDGVYYWRISATNSDNNQTEFSETGKFNIVLRKPVKLISPQAEEVINHSVSQNSVLFKWSEDELAAGYTLEIAGDKDFTGIINKIDTPLRSITIDNFIPGEYFWRVSSNINIGGEQLVRTGQAISFKIDKLKVINPPVLISPAKGEKIDAAILKTRGLTFNWNNDPSFSAYTVEISRNSDFTGELIRQDRNVNFAEIQRDIPAGKYFWRIEGRVPTGEKIPYSSTGDFEIVVSENLALVSPADNDEIKISSDAKKKDIQFSWKKSELKGSYKLQISAKEDFSDAKTVNFNDRNTGTAPIETPGIYFWRVLLTDDQNREILKSNTSKFVVSAEEVIPVTKTFLIVKSPIKGGKIYIDSKFKAYTEFKQEVRPDADISVRIIAPGYTDFSRKLKVNSGETYTLSATMEKSKKLERVKWITPLTTPISATPVYYKDKIVFCSENGHVVILNSIGSVLLSKKITRRFESKPVVYENNIFAVDVDGVLYSIDSSTGKVNWQVKAGGPLLFKSELAVSNGKIFLGTGYGIVEAYSLDGKKLWENELDEAIYNSLLVVKNSLIIATDALKLYSLDAGDGDKNWSAEIDEKVITLTPLVHKDIIYFGCYSGTFYAVSLDDGDIIWTFKSGGPIYSSPVVVDKSIYFGSEDGFVYSLNDEKGTLNWQFKSSLPVKSSPVYAFGSIVVANDRTIFSLNPLNGSVLWQTTFDSRIKTSPSFAGDTVIMGLANGDIVSVRNNLIEIVQ